jgi:chromosome segregation ATPase
MGRPSAISYEQVAIFAQAIKEEGAEPTQNAIYERLGRRGSMGTIHKYLAQWREGRSRQAEVTLSLPPAVQRTILEFLGQEIGAQRRELEEALNKANQAVSELASENERQQFDIEELSESLSNERSACASLQGRIDQLQAEHERNSRETRGAIDAARLDAVREREIAGELRVELAKVILRLEGIPHLENSLERSQKELEDERKARHEAECASSATQASLEAARDFVANIESRLKDQKLRSAEIITKLETDKQNLSAEIAKTRKDAAEIAAKLARLEGVLEQMRSSQCMAEMIG